jgi:hypothetical protein
MILSEDDRKFLTQRNTLSRMWPVVGTLLTTLWFGFGVWVYFRVPLLANPIHMFTALSKDAVPQSSLVVLASFCPLLFAMIWFGVFVIFFWHTIWMRIETRYKEIVAKLDAENGRNSIE